MGVLFDNSVFTEGVNQTVIFARFENKFHFNRQSFTLYRFLEQALKYNLKQSRISILLLWTTQSNVGRALCVLSKL